MEGFNETMGKRIRELRNKAGLLQSQVADELHIKRETYNTIENGHRSLKDVEIIALTRILNTTTDYILTGVETPYIDAVKDTGLSNEAITCLHKRKIYGRYGQSYFDTLNMLICSESGQYFVNRLDSYLKTDFKKLYIFMPDSKNPKKGKLAPYHGYVFFREDDMDWGIEPEQLEAGYLEKLRQQIAKMKDEYLKNGEKEGDQ